MASSVKWLVVDAGTGSDGKRGERVSLLPSGGEVVDQFPAKPLNLIAIWGEARTGKSFFLNALAQTDGLFPVSAAMETCTTGADISRTLQKWSDFARGGDAGTKTALSDPENPALCSELPMVGFVDVEGQGDHHPSYDVLLATPLLLLSKVVIFNCKGRPKKSAMLDQLAVMTSAAEEIAGDVREGIFGHLLILLRDVPDTPEEEQKAHDTILGGEDPRTGGTSQERTNIGNRNKTREQLHSAFQSVSVRCLRSPHEDIDEEDGIELTKLKTTFVQKMAVIRGQLLNFMAEPHTFGGEKILGGPILSTLMSRVCADVNAHGKNIVPSSLMDSVIRQRVDALVEAVRNDLKARVTKLRDGDHTYSKKEIQELLDQVKKDTGKKFDSDLQDLGEFEDKAMDQIERDFKALSDRLFAWYEENLRQLRERLFHYVQLAEASVDSKAITTIEPRLPMRGEQELVRAWEQVREDVYTLLDKKISETVSDNLREDLRESIPTKSDFKESVEAKLRHITERNKLYIRMEDTQEQLKKQVEQEKDARMKEKDATIKEKDATMKEKEGRIIAETEVKLVLMRSELAEAKRKGDEKLEDFKRKIAAAAAVEAARAKWYNPFSW